MKNKTIQRLTVVIVILWTVVILWISKVEKENKVKQESEKFKNKCDVIIEKMDSVIVRLGRIDRKINVCVQDHMGAGIKYNFEVTE